MSDLFNYSVMPRGGLASGMNDSILSLALSAGTGAQFPSAGPFTVTISLGTLLVDPTTAQMADGETVGVLSRSGDTLTLYARNLNGNASTLTHSTGDLVQLVWSPADLERLHGRLLAIEAMLSNSVGSVDTGVKVISPDYDQLQVVEQAIPDMTLKIKAGVAFVDRMASQLTADYTTPTIVAPVTSTRIDLITIKGSDDSIVVTTGGEGSGTPATPVGHCPLAEVTITTSHTTLETGDILDARPSL